MRKTVPFVLTIVVSVLCTATLVRAAGSGSETALEPTLGRSEQAPRLGARSSNTCNSSPEQRLRVDRVRQMHDRQHVQGPQWAKVLDTCFTTFQVTDRAERHLRRPCRPALVPERLRARSG